MKPRDTKYVLASSPADYKACKKLDPEVKCKFPTILAYRGKTPVGFVTTYYTKSGPMVSGLTVSVDGHKAFVAMRLLEAYESVLLRAGIHSYLFFVENTNPRWKTSVQEIAKLRYDLEDGSIFEKELA